MSLHEHPSCIVVDIQGGKNCEDWKICASSIIRYALTLDKQQNSDQKYTKSVLFEGKGVDGIVGLAAGLIEAAVILRKKTHSCHLMGPVVGYSEKTMKVTKAYDGATYRHPNFDIVQDFLDKDAIMFESKDKKLVLVETNRFDCNWEDAVPFSVFAALLDDLIRLHDKSFVHGDIRLANMVRKKTDATKEESGCYIDFDFVRKKIIHADYEILLEMDLVMTKSRKQSPTEQNVRY